MGKRVLETAVFRWFAVGPFTPVSRLTFEKMAARSLSQNHHGVQVRQSVYVYTRYTYVYVIDPCRDKEGQRTWSMCARACVCVSERLSTTFGIYMFMDVATCHRRVHRQLYIS